MPFRDITGHQPLLHLVAQAAARGTLPPSLVFAGPEGVGKRMAGVALAQFLNCLSPAGLDACGACAPCRRIARGVHSDVLLIEPGDTGSINIAAVREAIVRSGYRPFEGRRRVVIIDQADEVLVEGQNALLKTLEEPPPASVFVLVTSRPDVLLPTVQSRCQKLRFGRLSPGEVADVLVRDHAYADADAHAAASLSDGSVGAALAGGSEAVVDAREAAVRLLETLAGTTDPRRRVEGAKDLAGVRGKSDRADLGRRLRAVSSILRDVAVLLSRADEGRLANADLAPLLKRLQRTFDSGRVVRAFSAVERALSALDRNASPKIVADWIAFQI